MIIPDKFTSYASSLLSRLPLLMHEIDDDTSVTALYKKTARHFEDVVAFMFALDALFILGRIELVPETGRVRHAS